MRIPDQIGRSFSLRHLAALLAVVECGQIAGAGKRLNKSASSVAKSIDILEGKLDRRLLERSVGGVKPTRAGKLVAARAGVMVRELSGLRDNLLRSRGKAIRANAALFSLHIDVSRLRALAAVRDFGSVQRARQFLDVSQPAISASIRFLETDLGVELFSRTPAGMIATPAGITTTLSAKRILSELRKIQDEAASADGPSSGHVCIGGLAFSRSTILPAAINRILSDFPQIQVRTVEGPIDTLVSAMHAGEIDVLICARPDPSLLEGVLIEPIVDDSMALFVSAGHPLAARKNVSAPEAVDFPFILPPQGSVTRKLLDQAFMDAAGRPPQGTVETSSYTVIRHLLLNSPQIAFRSGSEFGGERMAKEIAPLDVSFFLPARVICILTRRGVLPTPAVRDCLAVIRDVASMQWPNIWSADRRFA